MGDLPNLASSVLLHSVAFPSSSLSFLKSSRLLSSTLISCMSRPLESPSSVKSAVTRPYSDERDMVAADTFLAVALPPSMICSIGEAIGRLLAVSMAEEGFCFALLWARGSLFSHKCCIGWHLHVPCTTLSGSGVLGQLTWESVNCGIARIGTGTKGCKQCVW